MINKTTITEYFKTLQDSICHQLEAADGVGKFQQDLWEREGGGGGRTRVIRGQHIEKGGVNFSAVFGELTPQAAKALHTDSGSFYATGVSIVLHPQNPWVPIIHMNVRYFEMNEKVWWFGGGIDLTPHYINKAEAQFFHQQLKAVCDQHHPEYYPRFKKWADDYFFLKHRNETRGVGGIFFDRMSEKNGKVLMNNQPIISGEGNDSQHSRSTLFEFVKGVGEAFAPIYVHFLQKNKHQAYGEREKSWQMLRRGRYVEFNLVWDRGTKFGLETNGRTESILMSLPPLAQWEYDHQPEPDSKEAHTLNMLRKDVEWIDQVLTF